MIYVTLAVITALFLFSLGKVVQHRRHKALGYSRTRQR